MIRCPRPKCRQTISLWCSVPWTIRPLGNAAPTRPLDNASLGRCAHWTVVPDRFVLTQERIEGFVTIYECNVCPAAPLKSYLNQPSLGHDPMFLDPSVRDALSKGRLPGAPQARLLVRRRNKMAPSISYMYYHLQRIKNLRSSSLMFDITPMSV